MFKSMAITSTENGNILYIDNIAVLGARRISDVKFFSGQHGVAAIYEKNGKRHIVFITQAADQLFLERHVEFDPQPASKRVVLEISCATDLPFAHYNIQNGMICIVTQCGNLGMFEETEAERLLEHIRKEIWCLCVRNANDR